METHPSVAAGLQPGHTAAVVAASFAAEPVPAEGSAVVADTPAREQQRDCDVMVKGGRNTVHLEILSAITSKYTHTHTYIKSNLPLVICHNHKL